MIDEGMDKSELVLLKFTKKETRTKLRWEHSREFEYNHRMYDIVEKKTVGDTVYYWCWYDHMETMLNFKLEELVSQAVDRSEGSQKKRSFLASSIKSLYCIFSFDINFSLSQLLNKPEGLFSDLYPKFSIQPPTPPPQFI